jgi:hypothetical protein
MLIERQEQPGSWAQANTKTVTAVLIGGGGVLLLLLATCLCCALVSRQRLQNALEDEKSGAEYRRRINTSVGAARRSEGRSYPPAEWSEDGRRIHWTEAEALSVNV